MSREQAIEAERMLREGPLDLGGDLAVQRPLLDQLMIHPLAPSVTTRDIELNCIPGVDIRIDRGTDRQVLLYFHGGAYALGSALGGAALAAELAGPCGIRAVSVEYRLAPEHPFPAALDDALAAYQGLLDEGIAAENIVVSGESAGGGLALALLGSLAGRGLPAPAAAVVLSPWADLTLSGRTVQSKTPVDAALTPRALRVRAADYVADHDPADPRISPLFADYRGFPPLLLQVGSHEILLADAVRVAERAALADVAVTLQVTPAVPHVFQGFAAILSEGREALAHATAFIRHHLSS